MRLKDGTTVHTGMYVQSVRSLYKVSALLDGVVRMQICLDNGHALTRTIIRTYTEGQLGEMTTPTPAIVTRYHKLLAGGAA
jgi:hypothetical protein